VGFVKNLPNALRGVDLHMRRVEAMTREQFQDFIWEVFKRILRETPQWSGKGVANWNLSIGAPNFSYDPSLGDEVGAVGKNFHVGQLGDTHERGDERWMRIARNRARPIKNRIFLKDKVFISNGVTGDGDDVGAEQYIQALQDPFYWAKKLREVNKPYEVAQESVIVVAMQTMRRGLFSARVGGSSWE
jgi:hypothetical protein